MDHQLIQNNIVDAIESISNIRINYISKKGNQSYRVVSPWSLGEYSQGDVILYGFQHTGGTHIGLARYFIDYIMEIQIVSVSGVPIKRPPKPSIGFDFLIIDGFYQI